jgi:hypothetical protein
VEETAAAAAAATAAADAKAAEEKTAADAAAAAAAADAKAAEEKTAAAATAAPAAADAKAVAEKTAAAAAAATAAVNAKAAAERVACEVAGTVVVQAKEDAVAAAARCVSKEETRASAAAKKDRVKIGIEVAVAAKTAVQELAGAPNAVLGTTAPTCLAPARALRTGVLGASTDKQLAARWQRLYKAPSPYMTRMNRPGTRWLREILGLSALAGQKFARSASQQLQWQRWHRLRLRRQQQLQQQQQQQQQQHARWKRQRPMGMTRFSYDRSAVLVPVCGAPPGAISVTQCMLRRGLPGSTVLLKLQVDHGMNAATANALLRHVILIADTHTHAGSC